MYPNPECWFAVLEAERRAGRELRRVHLPIFQTAVGFTTWVVDRGPQLLAYPPWLWHHRLSLGVAAAAIISLVAACFAIQS